MWIVVEKIKYYPTVYECQTREEALKVYEERKESAKDIPSDEIRLYIAKVEDFCGDFNENVLHSYW